MSESNPAESVSTNNDSQPVRPKRGIRKKFLIGLGLLFALALGYNAFRSWQASSLLESRLEALRKQGVALTLDELQAERLSEEDNAQTWIRRARPQTEALNKLLSDYQQSEEFDAFRPNADQIEVLEKAFSEHAEAFEFYAKASSCQGFQSDWRIGELPSESLQVNMDDSAEARSIMRHFVARAGLLMAKSDFDEALELGLQLLAFSRRVAYPPMVIGYLGGVAGQSISLDMITAVLERTTLTDVQRTQVDDALAECEAVDGFKHAIASECVYGLTAFRKDIFGGPVQSMVMWKFKLDACDYLDLMRRMDEWASEPRYAIADEFEHVADQESGQLTQMIVPALLQVRRAHDRGLARVRCVRLLNALQRQYPGGIPNEPSLDELPGSEDSRLDPFSGDSLKVLITAEEVVVYSVAANVNDDGGIFDAEKDHGIRIRRLVD